MCDAHQTRRTTQQRNVMRCDVRAASWRAVSQSDSQSADCRCGDRVVPCHRHDLKHISLRWCHRDPRAFRVGTAAQSTGCGSGSTWHERIAVDRSGSQSGSRSRRRVARDCVRRQETGEPWPPRWDGEKKVVS